MWEEIGAFLLDVCWSECMFADWCVRVFVDSGTHLGVVLCVCLIAHMWTGMQMCGSPLTHLGGFATKLSNISVCPACSVFSTSAPYWILLLYLGSCIFDSFIKRLEYLKTVVSWTACLMWSTSKEHCGKDLTFTIQVWILDSVDLC